MSIGHGAPARPVADAPIDGLLEHTHDLAKRWMLAIAGARDLAEMATLPFAQIASDAPSLCSGVLSALRSDDAFSEEGVRRPSGAEGGAMSLAWSEEPTEAVAAVEALRGVLWDALVQAAGSQTLGTPSPFLIRDLADRLAYVCSVVLAASLQSGTRHATRGRQAASDPSVRTAVPSSGVPAPQSAPPWTARVPSWSAPAFPGEPTVRRRQPPPSPWEARPTEDARASGHAQPVEPGLPSYLSLPEQRGVPDGPPADPEARSVRGRAVIVDEFVQPPASDRARVRSAPPVGRERARPAGGSGGHARADGRPLPWDIPLARESPAVEGGRRRAPGDSRGARGGSLQTPDISKLRRRPPRERE